jgi:hypothetical protein
MGAGGLESVRPSLLRRSILLVGLASLGTFPLATAAPAAAGGLAPDPAPATDVRPDAYPAPRAPEPVATPAPRPTTVTKVVVVRPPATVVSPPAHPRKGSAPPHRRTAPKPKPQRRLPFPTLAIKWFSGAAVPAVRSREVPPRVALVLAALVLASAVLVAGAAREAAR